MNKRNLISVIIPTYNEEKDIRKCLISLNKQSYKNIEIIVVDDGSTDKTQEIVKKFKKVKLVKGQHKGPGFSRNLGAKNAKGDILVFVDADMTFDKDYIKNLIAPLLKDNKIIGTTHDYEIANNIENVWSRCWGKKRVDYNERKRYSNQMVIFRAIKKNNFKKMQGFDPKFGYADDQTFWLKYKILPYIAKNAICYHRNPETLKEIYKQNRWIGASIMWKIKSLQRINYFIPFIMIITSPIAIPLLSIIKCQKNDNFRILIPWMFIFMSVRYFGTITGLFRRTHLKKNVK